MVKGATAARRKKQTHTQTVHSGGGVCFGATAVKVSTATNLSGETKLTLQTCGYQVVQ